MPLTHQHEIDPLDICSPGSPCQRCLADPGRPATPVIEDKSFTTGTTVVCFHEDPPPPPPVPGGGGGTPVTPTAKTGPSAGKVVAVVVVVVAVVVIIFLLSDRRLKRDILLLHRRPDGIGIYRYRYYWSAQYYVGVMAQEVAEIIPDAVFRGTDDFLRVDYARLGLQLERWEDFAPLVASEA